MLAIWLIGDGQDDRDVERNLSTVLTSRTKLVDPPKLQHRVVQIAQQTATQQIITLYTRTRLRLRAAPNTQSAIIKTLERGQKVQSLERSGIWHKVIAGGQTGWLHGDFLTPLEINTAPPRQSAIRPPAPSGQTFNCTTPIPTLKDQMIRESIARYSGNCPCDYNVDRGGRRCGRRSAWSRPGGASPLCYPSDISADMVREFCEVLKLRGAAR